MSDEEAIALIETVVLSQVWVLSTPSADVPRWRELRK